MQLIYFITKKTFLFSACSFLFFIFSINKMNAQGTWTPLANTAPDTCGGVMLLLTDGTVIAKSYLGGVDSIGSSWNKLTPDVHGSYVNGTWSSIAAMHDSRLYFASQVLKDGRVLVAGGEYGSGVNQAEVYNPLTDTWVMTPPPGASLGDAGSQMLPDGTVLTAIVGGGSHGTTIYNPQLNTWTPAATCLGSHNETSWLKLHDQSILMVDVGSINSERYIPSLNQWIMDAQLPVQLYDPFGSETGAALLLPDGRGFFIGATNHTAIYTPSGSTAMGSWAAGPDIPNNHGAVDAAAAMMVNGKILCAVGNSPVSFSQIFDPPTWFYEYDYVSNSFTQINAHNGLDTLSEPCYYTNMLQLPDGKVLYGDMESIQYYVYSPSGAPLAAAKPIIDSLWEGTNCTYTIAGSNFNGISAGAAYGDDWQMDTNYPLVRLTNGTNVYYARTYNWNRTGVQTGALPDTTQFSLPINLPFANYWLQVVVNGIASDSVAFTPCTNIGIQSPPSSDELEVFIYPNPATNEIRIMNYKFGMKEMKIYNIMGEMVFETKSNNQQTKVDISNFAKGVYFMEVQGEKDVLRKKFVKE